MMTDETAKPRSTKVLWILLLVTGLPYLLSWIYFANRDLLPLPAPTNRGELLQPALQLPDASLNELAGDRFRFADHTGKWVLLAVSQQDCDEACQRNLYVMRQSRLAMGQGRSKVERVLLIREITDQAPLDAALDGYQGTRVVLSPPAAVEQTIAALAADGRVLDGAAFIIDPRGEAILYYQPGYDPQHLLKDLERLLKIVEDQGAG